MDDLKEKIAELERVIENNWNINKFYEITKIALERNELIKLFSADSSYIYNDKGELWLQEESEFNSSNFFYTENIFDAFFKIYKENQIKNLEKVFVNTLKEMTNGTPEQLYFAVGIFSHFCYELTEEKNVFFGINLDSEIENELRTALKKRIEKEGFELEKYYFYECSYHKCGLLGYCVDSSTRIVELICGRKGFMPDDLFQTELTSVIENIKAEVKKTYGKSCFYEITKIALERGELIKLLSADPSYIYDSKGYTWLAADRKLGPDTRPIIVGTIISALEKIYYETKSNDIRKEFIEAVKKMIYGTPQQFFLAIECFREISEEIQGERSRACYSKFDYFKEYNELPTLDDELRPFIIKAIEEKRDFLKENSAYDVNLWEHCEYHSGKLIEYGLIGFMPEIR